MVKQVSSAKRKTPFSPHAFLSTIGKGREMFSFQKKNVIFAQGDSTDGLFFIQKGKVRLSVVSEAGKEATLGIFGEGDFLGEGGLAGQLLRMSSAIATTECVLLRIEKEGDDAGYGAAAKIVGCVSEVLAATKHPASG